MKNISRLALALAVATIACLTPVAHADEQAFFNNTPLQTTRQYDYYDKDGYGTLVVEDGPKHSWGREIYVTLYQNGYTFSGHGKRDFASYSTNWLAYCDFYLSGSGPSGHFKGYLPIFPGFGPGGGTFYYDGSWYPHYWKVTYNG